MKMNLRKVGGVVAASLAIAGASPESSAGAENYESGSHIEIAGENDSYRIEKDGLILLGSVAAIGIVTAIYGGALEIKQRNLSKNSSADKFDDITSGS